MILECRNLTKTYRGKKAVSDLSIRLDEDGGRPDKAVSG